MKRSTDSAKQSIGKAQLVKMLADKVDFTFQDARSTIESLLELIKTSILDDHKVSLKGFGVFSVIPTKPRNGINPQTKEPIKIPASRKITFVAAKPLKESIKGSHKKRVKPN